MSKVPKRRAQDLSKLALGPADKHLLSFVDGWLGEQDLAFITGQSLEAVHADLERLAAAGHIDLVEPGHSKPPPPPDGTQRPPESRGQPAEKPVGQAVGGRGVEGTGGSDAADGIQLSSEDRQAIDELHGTLDGVSDEELLGVGPDASTSEIRKAYNKLARRFHPDRHFRKNLGPYKQKIEEIFVRLTAAHDAMRAARRAQPKTAPPPAKQTEEPSGGRASQARPPGAAAASPPASIEPSTVPKPPQPAMAQGAQRWGTAAAEAIRIDAAEPSGPSGAHELSAGPRAGERPAAPDARVAPVAVGSVAAGQPRAAAPFPGPGSNGAHAPPSATQPAPPDAGGRASSPAMAPERFGASNSRPVGPGTTLRSRVPAPSASTAARPPPVVSIEGESAPVERAPDAAVAQAVVGLASHAQPAGASRPAPVQRRPPAAAPSAPAAAAVDPEAARRARAEALARRLGRRAPGGAAVAIHRGARAPVAPGPAAVDPSAPTPAAQPTAEPDVPVEPYVPVASAPKSAAEKFRERFGALEARARERRSHAHVAEAIAALSRGDYRSAAEAYRLASELAPEDAALARKAAEIGKLAMRRRR